jgi:hypothetical protein
MAWSYWLPTYGLNWGIVLTVLGGIAELGGIYLVAKDIQRDQELAAKYVREWEQQPNLPTPSFHGPPKDPRLIEGPDAAALQRDVQRVALAAQQASGAARGRLDRQRTAFTGFISALLQGGVERRRLGVKLFAVGVVMNVAGNVISAS